MNTFQIPTNTNFKGYDARLLKGFLMSSNSHGIADEMAAIGKKEGFKIFSISDSFCKEGTAACSKITSEIWAQDLWSIVENRLLTLEENNYTKSILKYFNINLDKTQVSLKNQSNLNILNNKIWGKSAEIVALTELVDFDKKELELKVKELENLKNSSQEINYRHHIPGGNIFLIKENNKNEVLIGEDELAHFSIDDIKKIYNANKVISLPQMDYHIDLFVRPLDKKRILLADDEKSKEVLKLGIKKMENYFSTHDEEISTDEEFMYDNIYYWLDNFTNIISENSRPNTNEIEKILTKNGYEVIKVPGRLYEYYSMCDEEDLLLQHQCNYINANVLKNNNDELVYITNKSNFDKLLGITPDLAKKFDFSFENEFKKSILPYIKNEHIYFVSGTNDFVAEQMLPQLQGGIHCACSEIPLDKE